MARSPAHFILAWITVLAFGYVFIGAVNWFVDPLVQFRNAGYEKKVSEILRGCESGQLAGVRVLPNMDERLLYKMVLTNLSEAPEVLVVGSSRVRYIGQDLFPKQRVFNASPNGATVRDYMSAIELVVSKKNPAKHVVLGVDPWIFNSNSRRQHRWKSWATPYFSFITRIGLEKTSISNENGTSDNINGATFDYRIVKNLFGLDNFTQSMELLFKEHYIVTPIPTFQRKMISSTYVIHCDGVMGYPESVIEKPRHLVRESAFYAAQAPYSFENYSKQDLGLVNLLSTTMSFLKDQGIRVTIFLTPFHPHFYKYINRKDLIMMQKAESTVRSIAKSLFIPVKGSYDPARTNCEEGDFFDFMHVVNKCVDRLFLLGNEPG